MCQCCIGRNHTSFGLLATAYVAFSAHKGLECLEQRLEPFGTFPMTCCFLIVFLLWNITSSFSTFFTFHSKLKTLLSECSSICSLQAATGDSETSAAGSLSVVSPVTRPAFLNLWVRTQNALPFSQRCVTKNQRNRQSRCLLSFQCAQLGPIITNAVSPDETRG